MCRFKRNTFSLLWMSITSLLLAKMSKSWAFTNMTQGRQETSTSDFFFATGKLNSPLKYSETAYTNLNQKYKHDYLPDEQPGILTKSVQNITCGKFESEYYLNASHLQQIHTARREINENGEKLQNKFKKIRSKSPCQNGGIFSAVNGSYVCDCVSTYSGINCEMDTAICNQPIEPQMYLPCVMDKKVCRPVAGGGFICESRVVRAVRNTSLDNLSNPVKCDGQSLCPKYWDCYKLHKMRDAYRCEPPFDDESTQNKLVDTKTGVRNRRSPKIACNWKMCHHGARCKNNKCACLINYTGKWCENEINYCKSNPCPTGVSCEPRLGGFYCDCPLTHTGLRCEKRKRILSDRMRSPHFNYVIEQYPNMFFTYFFHVRSKGDLPEVTVNFGDGRIETSQKNNFKKINREVRQNLSLSISVASLPKNAFGLIFEHKYNKTGVYKVSVEARNLKYLVYKSKHKVRVDSPHYCAMDVRIHNKAEDARNAITYTRKNIISIISDVKVNCSHSELVYQWSIHKVDITQNVVKFSEDTFYTLPQEISTVKENLIIYPFTLPFGLYVAFLDVMMIKPRADLEGSAKTWFYVRELQLKALLTEGSLSEIHWYEPNILNASLSYDPNQPKNKQTPLGYVWTCYAQMSLVAETAVVKDQYCPPSVDIALHTGGPILYIPPKSLVLNWRYIFSVQVTATHYVDANLPESIATVAIDVRSQSVPLVRIKCSRNCEDNYVKQADFSIFEGICLSCNDTIAKSLKSLEWQISLRTMKGLEQGVKNKPVRTVDGNDKPVLMIEKSALLEDNHYTIRLKVSTNYHVVNSSNSTDIGFEGVAERIVRVNHAPTTGYCYSIPSRGFALFTNFHFQCSGFIDRNSPLRYEVTQYSNVTNISNDVVGTVVGYNTSPDIDDIRLAPGLAEFDHVTLVRIIISSENLYTFFDYNVTVLPALYYIKSPTKVMTHLRYMAQDPQSYLALLVNSDNTFGAIEMIWMTAETTENLLYSDYIRYFNIETLMTTISVIRESLLEKMFQQPVIDICQLKHYATALNAILRLPGVGEEMSTITCGQLLEKLVKEHETLVEKEVPIRKEDVEDLGSLIMAVSSQLMAIPPDQQDRIQMGTFGFSKSSEDETLETKTQTIDKEEKQELERFIENLIKNIFDFGKHILPHKAVAERITLCKAGHLQFSAQKSVPTLIVKKGLHIGGRVGVMPIFPKVVLDRDYPLNILGLYMENNPYWWQPQAVEISFPVVNYRLSDQSGKRVNFPTKVMTHNPNRLKHKTTHGKLNIFPYWTLNDFDIEVNRIHVPKGDKVIVEFFPLDPSHRYQVVVKKDRRPELIDFWKEATLIPQHPQKSANNGEKFSIYVDETSTSDDDMYYIGILPHIDTLHHLLGQDIRESVFPPKVGVKEGDRRNKLEGEYEARREDERFGGIQEGRKGRPEKKRKHKGFDRPWPMKVRESTNLTLPYEYAAYGVQCMKWNDSARVWAKNCELRPPSTYETVFCQCEDLGMVSVSFENLAGDLNVMRNVDFLFPSYENPLAFYVMFFILVLFGILMLWALWLDRDDRPLREVLFLADNDPRHEYAYAVIVQTGRRPRAGTTSNVAFQLVGENGNTEVHMLRSALRPVMCRGSRDWFVLRTSAHLGSLTWINLWHDHRGASPLWYCSKVIVHDVQTDEMWFFVTEQWLAPLYGDGTMACSVYRTANAHVFEKSSRFAENVAKAFGDGLHGWFGMMYKSPDSTYSRCQRVAVAFAHVLVLLLIVVHMFERPTEGSSPGASLRKWSTTDLVHGVLAAVMAFPVHCALVGVFGCMAPTPPWLLSPSKWRHYLTADKPFEGLEQRRSGTSPQVDLTGVKRYYPVSFSLGQGSPHEAKKGPPLVGRIGGEETFCLPHWFKYLLWFILALFIVASLFLIFLNCVEYSKTTSYWLLITLITALLFSMLVLEMMKVFFYVIVRSVFSNDSVTVEDRSDLVWYLEDEYRTIPEFFPQKLEELQLLRMTDEYTPIPEQRVSVLHRNAIKVASLKGMIADFGMLVLFVFLLLSAIHGIHESHSYYNLRHLKNFIQGQGGFGKTTLNNVVGQDGFLNYINSSLLPILYAEIVEKGRRVETFGLTTDLANHLIGVPRLRQIRLDLESCSKVLEGGRKWAGRCSGDPLWITGDTRDYGVSWRPFKWGENNSGGFDSEWLHRDWWSLNTVPTRGEVSTLGAEGYVALLGRSRQASHRAIDKLRENHWMDRRTAAVFLEFSVYNPNCHLVSTVTVLWENTVVGGHVVRAGVEVLTARTTDDTLPYLVFALFVILVLALLFFVHRDGVRIKRLRRRSYFGNVWYALNVLLAILGLVVTFALLQRTMLLDLAVEKLLHPDQHTFANFRTLFYWDELLLYLVAFILFLVILQVWHILSAQYNCNFMMTVLRVAAHSLLCYSLLMAILLSAFTFTGHVLFVSISGHFRTVLFSLLTVVGFSHHNFSLDSIGKKSHSYTTGSFIWAQLFCVAFFILYFLIFYWGFLLVLIEKLSRVRGVAVEKRWLDPLMASFMQMNLASVRDFGRRGFRRSQAETLFDDYVRATPGMSAARLAAMDRIVAQLHERDGASDEAFVARARETAMAAVVVELVEGQVRCVIRPYVMPRERELGFAIKRRLANEKKVSVLFTYLKILELEYMLIRLYKEIEQLEGDDL